MNDSSVLNRLADIEMPAPPDVIPLPILLTGLILLIAGAWLLIHHRSIKNTNKTTTISPPSPRMSALNDRLLAQWTSGNIDSREAAYRLATLLRLGLGLPQLPAQCPPLLSSESAEWESTINLFNSLRYQKSAPPQLTPAVFAHTQRWLKIIEGQAR